MHLLSSDTAKLMLAILQAERPAVMVNLPAEASDRTVANAYWFNLGYEACVRKLISLAEPHQQEDQIQETFLNPDEDKFEWPTEK